MKFKFKFDDSSLKHTRVTAYVGKGENFTLAYFGILVLDHNEWKELSNILSDGFRHSEHSCQIIREVK